MMKKLTLSKGKAIACLILLCLFLAQSCRKDNLMPNSNDLRNGLSIADAKQYFEKNFQNQIKPKAIMSKGSLNPSSPLQDIIYGKKPMWDASLLKNLSIQTNAVLVPLHKEGVYVNVSKTKMVKFGFLNYMMMYRDDKNNIITEWVELKPTENWLNSKISRKYEGRILVRDWDGKIKRVIDFSNDNINKTLNSAIGSKKLSVTKEALMSGGQQICFIKTTYTVTSGRSTCSCMGHTYEQWAAGECTCGDVPNQGYTTTITYETNLDCLEIEPDGPGGNNPPANPPRSNGSSSSSPIGNGGNGGTNPDDYNPMYCNPDPNYTTPTTPPPPGQDYAIPCSEMAIPDDDMPNLSGLATSLTTTELLIHYYNADPNTDMHLTNEEVAFLNRNTNIVEDLMNYLQAETLETKEFGRWEIKYLTENPSVDFGDFKNQFLGKPEGLDGEFNEAYWNDPNLVVPKQDLPSWADFSANFPTHDRPNTIYKDYTELLPAIGGAVGALYVPGGKPVNTCAIRISYALVRSGITIPDIGPTTINGVYHERQTLKDKDGKFYFIRAKELNAWMRRTFGTNDGDPKTRYNPNHLKITKSQAGTYGSNLPALLAGKKGIYCLVSDNLIWSSGHADLLYDDGTCGVKCHFDGPIDWIDVWILQ